MRVVAPLEKLRDTHVVFQLLPVVELARTWLRVML